MGINYTARHTVLKVCLCRLSTILLGLFICQFGNWGPDIRAGQFLVQLLMLGTFIIKVLTQDVIMCIWSLFPGFIKDVPTTSSNQRLNPYWTGKGLPTVFLKPGKFLARVRHATVIQIGLNYSGVGLIYCVVTSAAAREHSNTDIFFSNSCCLL